MRRILISSVVLAVLSTGLWGCAIFDKGPKAEELVMQQTRAFANDFLAGNADKILDYVSADFTSEHVESKAALAEHIKEAKDSGKAAAFAQLIKDHHGEIDLKEAKVKIEKGIATVSPITASADEGSVIVDLSFKRDPDKVWRIVGINVDTF